MSIYEKLGQLIMMDFRYWGKDKKNQNIPFQNSNPQICDIFRKYKLGSFILFKENIESNEQVISLLRDIQETNDIPLLFGIDQEGGRVNRLKQGTSTCGNMAVGATGDPENARLLSELIGRELYSLGINLNFAPVVDINSNPKNPIIGVRAYSDNPETVVKMAKASIQGYKNSNIIPCLKHFPGHGNTAQDTHLGTVNINTNYDTLEKVELYPYNNICKNNYDVVMTAHISAPALDNTKFKSLNGEIYLPASLSYKIITNLLREKFSFKGLVITDAMDMKAISNSLDPFHAVLKTITAGTDIAMMPVRVWSESDVYKLDDLFTKLKKEYYKNTTFANRVDESYERIIKFKTDKGLIMNPLFTLSKDKQIKLANQIVNSEEHQKIESNIALKSTTLVKSTNLIPYSLKNNINILIIDSDKARLNEFAEILKNISKQKSCNINIIIKEVSNKLSDDIKDADLVIVVSESLTKYNEIYSYINKLSMNKSINIAAITPYDINYMDNVQNYICIYGATSVDKTNYTKTFLKTNIIAALENIFDNGKITGKLPVDLA